MSQTDAFHDWAPWRLPSPAGKRARPAYPHSHLCHLCNLWLASLSRAPGITSHTSLLNNTGTFPSPGLRLPSPHAMGGAGRGVPADSYRVPLRSGITSHESPFHKTRARRSPCAPRNPPPFPAQPSWPGLPAPVTGSGGDRTVAGRSWTRIRQGRYRSVALVRRNRRPGRDRGRMLRAVVYSR